MQLLFRGQLMLCRRLRGKACQMKEGALGISKRQQVIETMWILYTPCRLYTVAQILARLSSHQQISEGCLILKLRFSLTLILVQCAILDRVKC